MLQLLYPRAAKDRSVGMAGPTGRVRSRGDVESRGGRGGQHVVSDQGQGRQDGATDDIIVFERGDGDGEGAAVDPLSSGGADNEADVAPAGESASRTTDRGQGRGGETDGLTGRDPSSGDVESRGRRGQRTWLNVGFDQGQTSQIGGTDDIIVIEGGDDNGGGAAVHQLGKCLAVAGRGVASGSDHAALRTARVGRTDNLGGVLGSGLLSRLVDRLTTVLVVNAEMAGLLEVDITQGMRMIQTALKPLLRPSWLCIWSWRWKS
ncbi:hypothetical protein PHYPSEUDO_008688 [Phytophthora pseudosyringae]|uniref:Uncharacterized protein n=1 Tax=Phytophthora pseudosyringae TaxID=221518 RepID=A0A8T1VEL6_9STRA|nr:hypothetical protein PHYPSEUDO_008688 [Phytophthora pseudosyringae]